MKRGVKIKDLTGQIFGRLTIVKFSHRTTSTYWICRCECGNIVTVSAGNLNGGSTNSCRCLQNEMLSKLSFRHGFWIGTKSQQRFYNIWAGMKKRCLREKNKDYFRYGGMGVQVCEKWLTFENFRDDMWDSYQQHVKKHGDKNTSLDRFPNKNGNYEPSNCRWSTNKEQCRNRRNSSKTDNYDLHKKFKSELLCLVWQALRKKVLKSKKLEFYVGLSVNEFRQYIESKFIDGMSWDNYGRGSGKWCIDHIKRCREFDLTKETERQQCFNYRNLRPMWEPDNFKRR